MHREVLPAGAVSRVTMFDSPHRHSLGDVDGASLARLGLIAVGTLAADQITKHWAVSVLANGTVELPGPVQLFLTANEGIAFGIASGTRAIGVVVGLSCVLLALVLRMQWVASTLGARLATGLLVGGVLGNLVDRMGRGAVVDFIHIRAFSVFNLADIAIVVALGTVLVSVIRSEANLEADLRKSREQRKPGTPASGFRRSW